MKATILKIFNFIKLHKISFIAGFAAVIVLSLAFVFGGDLSSPKTEAPQSTASAGYATSDEAADTTASVLSTAKAYETESEDKDLEESKDDKKSESQAAQDSDSDEDNASEEKINADSDAQESNSDNSASSENGKKDKYLTDPIPSGKPKPVEPQEQEIEDNTLYCTLSISCATILDNMQNLKKQKVELVPADGWILKPQKVEFKEGESVFDVLQRTCRENNIHMESIWTPMYNSAYVEGIGNLYEFDCGNMSGWMYKVNDWFPNYGCSRYELKNGDTVEWQYSCYGYGADLGASMPMS